MVMNRLGIGVAGLLLGGAVPLLAQRATTPLHLSIAYPGAGGSIDATDSIFVFGAVSDPSATLTLNGHPVHVSAGGGWLAWIAVPDDSVITLAALARTGAEQATATARVVRNGWVRKVGAWVDRGSLAPVGLLAVPRGEAIPFTLRAAPGSIVRLQLARGPVVQFAVDSLPDPVPEAIRAFGRDDRKLLRAVTGDRYLGVLRGNIEWPLEGSDRRGADLEPPRLEVIHGRDTTVTPWPITLLTFAEPLATVRLDADSGHRGAADPTTVGRALPGGTYTWFFPAGTRSRVDAHYNDLLRLRLDANAIAWVPRGAVHDLAGRAPATVDPRQAVMGAITLEPTASATRLRIPLSFPVPVAVNETANGLDITLYNAVANANWTRFGSGSTFVKQVTWRQENSDRVVISVTLDRPLWGWRTMVSGSDLLVDLRRPPPINRLRPLAGRLIAVDAGHPPGGACGPLGLCEPVANLAVAQLLRARLIAAGARVVMTRSSADSVGLWPRVARADSANVDLLVSIHYNALPEGLNPFTSTGTSVFFNLPHAKELADSLQSDLVARFRLRNLGVARGDLALTRATWYPAVLTEAASLSIPDQERLAGTAAGAARYADGILAGITGFLRARAAPSHQ